MADFYRAASVEERRAVVDSADLSALSFEALYRALATPPVKPKPAETGLSHRYTVGAQRERFPYGLSLPKDYDATRSYPLVIFLHGTVSRKKPKPIMARDSLSDFLRIEDAIQVFPSGWSEAKWWTPVQAENLARILNVTKAEVNVDTDKVFLLGISDGATGGFYQSATNPGPYAAFISVIGYPGVLKGSRVYLEENVYPINLRNLKILAFNTENDPLYPVEKMQFYVDAFRDLDIDMEMVADPYGGHDVNALKRAMPAIREYIAATRRPTHPERLTWQYESGSRQHRVAWLQVHALQPRARRDESLDALPGMQPTDGYTGLIELASSGNEIRVRNNGVAAYSLLLSPGQFDFNEPVHIVENGVSIFEGRVQPSKRVLLKYAIQDFDPRRLYGAEIEINN